MSAAIPMKLGFRRAHAHVYESIGWELWRGVL